MGQRGSRIQARWETGDNRGCCAPPPHLWDRMGFIFLYPLKDGNGPVDGKTGDTQVADICKRLLTRTGRFEAKRTKGNLSWWRFFFFF